MWRTWLITLSWISIKVYKIHIYDWSIEVWHVFFHVSAGHTCCLSVLLTVNKMSIYCKYIALTKKKGLTKCFEFEFVSQLQYDILSSFSNFILWVVFSINHVNNLDHKIVQVKKRKPMKFKWQHINVKTCNTLGRFCVNLFLSCLINLSNFCNMSNKVKQFSNKSPYD